MCARITITLDKHLIEEAKTLTSLRTNREVVDLALKELVKRLQRKKLLELRHEELWSHE